jgi:hypothetical protein
MEMNIVSGPPNVPKSDQNSLKIFVQVFLLMIMGIISYTLSCSKGRIEVRKGVLEENQTALA